jgi:hypothetical protein
MLRPATAFFWFGFLATSCLAPGVDIAPAPTDFAFVEIQLQG